MLAEGSRLVAHAVEDALARLDPLDLARHFLRRAVDEQLLEDLRGPLLGRHLHALAIPRQRAAAERQIGEARLAAQARGDFLVERDRVANVVEPHALGRHAGQQGDLGVVAARVADVRHAREHREVPTMVLQRLQVARGLIVLARSSSGKKFGACRPSGRLMSSMRFGRIAAAFRSAPRPIGSIASSSGRPMQTPAERQKRAAVQGRARHGVVLQIPV